MRSDPPILAAMILCLAGCGSGSRPGHDRLAPGSAAVVIADPYLPDPVSLFIPRDGSVGGALRLDSGVIVSIGDDPGDYVETSKDVDDYIAHGLDGDEEKAAEVRRRGPRKYGNDHDLSDHRLVAVVVESGPSKGLAGAIQRRNLRARPAR